MMTRREILIMAARVCHGLVALVLLTTQLHAQNVPAGSAPPSSVSSAKPAGATPKPEAKKSSPPPPKPGEPVTLSARRQEKHGDMYYLRGEAEADFRSYILRADEMTYNDDTGEATATGHVVLEGGPYDEHLRASHGLYNVNTGRGRFWDVVGTIGMKTHGKSVMLTSSSPFSFRGAIVDKAPPDKFIVHHGIITSCTLPRPKWWFDARRATVVPGEDAKMYYSSFWLWRAPLVYFPFFTHPAERVSRQSGLLLPDIGTSSTKGYIVGEGIFWAINRSMDATLAAEYLSKRGWAQHVDYYSRPDDNTSFSAHYYGVADRGVSSTTTGFINGVAVTLPATQSQGGEELTLTGVTQHENLRAVMDVDYLSSYLYRAAFSDAFHQAANTEVRSAVFLADNENGYSFGTLATRYQNYLSTNRDDVINITQAPGWELSSVDRPLGNTPLRFGFDTAFGLLARNELDFTEGGMSAGRSDIYPHLSLPLFWKGWAVRPDAAVRDTWYSNSLEPGGTPGQMAGTAVNRHGVEGQIEIQPPAISRVFARPVFKHTFKHAIEARIVYHDVSGVDNFARIPRFDYRDIYSDTNEAEYALVQRLYVKPVPSKACLAALAAYKKAQTGGAPAQAGAKAAGTPPPAAGLLPSAAAPPPPPPCATAPGRELVSWEVAQKHFFDPYFGGALIPGQSNTLESTVDFTAIGFLTQPRNSSPVFSRIRITNPILNAEWQLDYDTLAGHIDSSTANLTHHFPHSLTFGGGHSYLELASETVPSAGQPQVLGISQFNQFNLNMSYGHPNKPGFAATAVTGIDENLGAVQYSTFQATYNWDCCGFVFFYRRYAISNIRDEHEFRFALSLSNIGLAGTLLRQERLF
jgi:LPS-assembly protein